MVSKVQNSALILLAIIMLGGMALFYFLPNSIWAGAGIVASITSIGSLIHIKLLAPSPDNKIETTQTWVMLLIAIIGVVFVLYSKTAGYSDFYIGMGAGLSLVIAITYCVVLLIRFDQSVR
ncbi:hypothetical protein N9L92_02560 [Saprospiraceae bacterium]|nr:hypothetical protein [Saprospiraceae bacterium]